MKDREPVHITITSLAYRLTAALRKHHRHKTGCLLPVLSPGAKTTCRGAARMENKVVLSIALASNGGFDTARKIETSQKSLTAMKPPEVKLRVRDAPYYNRDTYLMMPEQTRCMSQRWEASSASSRGRGCGRFGNETVLHGKTVVEYTCRFVTPSNKTKKPRVIRNYHSLHLRLHYLVPVERSSSKQELN